VNMNPRTTKWFRNHAKYDDDHPRIALEIVARYARTGRERMKVMNAARRSLQLLNLALLTSSRAYSTGAAHGISTGHERRVNDRRQVQETIAFPDRRVIDRRGTAVSRAA
jgi:pyrroloquinoline quinone (PQQ) biosynthesis protein C